MTPRTIWKALRRGGAFVQANPQITYTIFLMIAIPLAFLASGQMFLDASRKNQERLEKERIGVLQDTFVEFASEKMGDPRFLADRLQSIAKRNSAISELKVVRFENGNPFVIASFNPNEEGKLDTVDIELYRLAGADFENSRIFPITVGGERHWRAVRAIASPAGTVSGFFVADISMAQIDAATRRNVYQAYGVLFLILVAIFILLLRHARIIDYTTLYRRLKEVDAMKDDFISIASHELRAPITALRWQIELAEKQHGIELGSFLVSTDQLAKLVGDILDVSRIEQGRIKLEPKIIDPSETLEAVTAGMRALAEGKGLTLTYTKTALPLISVDPDRFRQIITNLVSNAIKYTLAGSVIIKTAAPDTRLEIIVEDTGIGISAEDQKKLFGKFERIKLKETRDIGGTGLGLWITKQLTEAMHGTIAVESMRSVGSRFIVSFPISKAY